MNGINESLKSQKPAQSVDLHIGTGKERIRKRERHGESRTRLYKTWSAMKGRCKNKNATGYEYYGFKGVIVCGKWEESFLAFKNWAMKNGYKDNLQIDRIESNGNYEPSNCRFTTRKENLRRRYFTLREEALKYMSEKPLFWIDPKKIGLPEKVFLDLANDGVCNARFDPYNKSTRQYQIKKSIPVVLEYEDGHKEEVEFLTG